jgi:hypothetical protein
VHRDRCDRLEAVSATAGDEADGERDGCQRRGQSELSPSPATRPCPESPAADMWRPRHSVRWRARVDEQLVNAREPLVGTAFVADQIA